MIRELTEDDVVFDIIAERERLTVRGNTASTGDFKIDRKIENKILRRLRKGDFWAWSQVEVRASWNGFHGSDYLGCCSYSSEADFRNDGYYYDMRENALKELNEKIKEIFVNIQELNFD